MGNIRCNSASLTKRFERISHSQRSEESAPVLRRSFASLRMTHSFTKEEMMKTFLQHAAILLIVGVGGIGTARAESPAPAELDRYNVVWTTPSRNAAGSMPIGNGEVGLNVWVEENGDLLFYIARTDSWSECNRLLKLARVRVSLSPNPFAKGRPFRQELRFRDGQIIITAGDATLHLFVDANAPVIHVIGQSATPHAVAAALEDWRTEKHVLTGSELESSWTMLETPASIEVWESADVVGRSTPNSVAWRHRNAYSVVPLTLKHQSLESFAGLVKDPLLNRTFGGEMSSEGLVAAGNNGLKSAQPVSRFALSIIACDGADRNGGCLGT